MRRLLLVLVATLCSCKSKEQTTRERFSSDFTCPESSITVTERPDLDANELEWGPPSRPPREVASDPVRLELWKKQHARPQSGHVIFQAGGCKHEAFYSCGTSTGRGGGKAMCSKTSYEPHRAPAAKPNLSTLGTATLEDWQWTAVAAPPLVGKLEAFDVDANFDWAASIATAWSADAKLFTVRINGLTQDGTLDLSHINGNEVSYVFNSLNKGDVDLSVSVRQTSDPAADMQHPTGVQRQPHRDTTPRHPVTKPKCTLAQALAALHVEAVKAAPAKIDATYKVEALLKSDGVKPVWNFIYVTSKSQLTKLDSETCGVVK